MFPKLSFPSRGVVQWESHIWRPLPTLGGPMEATQGHFPPIMATFPDVGPWHVGGPEEATLGHFPRYGAMEPWSHGHPHTLVVVQWDKSPFI